METGRNAHPNRATLFDNEVRMVSLPFRAQHASTNEPLKIGQTCATLSLPLEEMHEVGRHFGATLNDVAVSVIDLRTTRRAWRDHAGADPPSGRLDRHGVISNIAGAKETRYLNGARLLGIYPVSALAASVGLNATLSSYHDCMDFGFVANAAAIDDRAFGPTR